MATNITIKGQTLDFWLKLCDPMSKAVVVEYIEELIAQRGKEAIKTLTELDQLHDGKDKS